MTWECVSSCDNSDSSLDGRRHLNPMDLLAHSEDNDKEEITVNEHNDANLKDPQSTGRKRAAILFPIRSESDCEWKMKKNCGGGKRPIIGCTDGKQQARHHGPDKNTLNNDEGNVHRICHKCHNRWHTENDEDYEWGALHPLHTPVGASIEELLLNEANWIGRKIVKAQG